MVPQCFVLARQSETEREVRDGDIVETMSCEMTGRKKDGGGEVCATRVFVCVLLSAPQLSDVCPVSHRSDEFPLANFILTLGTSITLSWPFTARGSLGLPPKPHL